MTPHQPVPEVRMGRHWVEFVTGDGYFQGRFNRTKQSQQITKQ